MIEMPAAAHLNAGHGALLLKPHALLYPPVVRGSNGVAAESLREFNAGMGTLWRPVDDVVPGSDSLLTMRYFGMQSLQLRLEQLMQGPGTPYSPAVDLFLRGRFDHVYVDAAGYRRLAAAAGEVLGDPHAQPLFFDLPGQRLVVDMSRCFVAHASLPTADAVRGLVAMTESPRFQASLDRSRCGIGPDASAAQVALAGHTLREAARCVTRHVLKEPLLQLSAPAERLAREVGTRVVARALLTGAAGEIEATVAAFAAWWKQGPPATLQG